MANTRVLKWNPAPVRQLCKSLRTHWAGIRKSLAVVEFAHELLEVAADRHGRPSLWNFLDRQVPDYYQGIALPDCPGSDLAAFPGVSESNGVNAALRWRFFLRNVARVRASRCVTPRPLLRNQMRTSSTARNSQQDPCAAACRCFAVDAYFASCAYFAGCGCYARGARRMLRLLCKPRIHSTAMIPIAMTSRFSTEAVLR